MRSALLLTSTIILALLLSLDVSYPGAEQSEKKEAEDETSEILERIRWFKERHPELEPKLRLKRARDEYQSREAFRKQTGMRQMAAATSWISLGPSNGAGRITSVAVHPTPEPERYACGPALRPAE